MNDKSLKSLEFVKIKEMLRDKTSCELSSLFCSELAPNTDIDEISILLKETEDAVNYVLRRGSAPMSGVKDLRPSFRRAGAGGILSFSEFISIAGLLTAVRRMISYGETADIETDSTTQNYINSLTGNRDLEREINSIFISDTEIADDASYTLLEIRRKIVSTQNSIKEKLGELTRSSKYEKALQDAVVTLRGDRYCVPVKVEHRSDIPGIVHDTSSSGQTLFIEPSFVVDANNKIRELKVAEQEEIQRILLELSGKIALNEYGLTEDLLTLSKLDFIFAKASLAIDMNGILPEINDEGRISLIKARHPLIEKHKVVPVTVHLKNDIVGSKTSCMIITGPNTGGKTVTLKTIGLLTLMLQSGLLVPCAEGSCMSIFTGIYADIGDEQSIAQNLSTFSAHMKNITEILSVCDYRSLVLFDELGAGTDPTEGAALAMSILECVYQMGASVFATTHYSELKIFASTTPGFINASCEFDVDTLRPTYKLLIGVPGKSNAFAISEKLGLDIQIIERAKEFLTNEDLRFEDMLSGIEKSRAEIDENKAITQELKDEAEKLRNDIAKEREELKKEREQMVDKMREQAAEITRKARVSADKMLTEIRKVSINITQENVKLAENAKKEFEDNADDNDAQAMANYKSDEYSKTKPPETLKPGDNVVIVSLGTKATVLSKPSNGTVYLQAGIIKMYRPLDDLRLSNQPPEQIKSQRKNASSNSVSMKAQSVKLDIDVRGLTVEEACVVIDRHINDAVMGNQPTFNIIHGKGTGALRKGIHDYLKRCKNVKDFRLGTYGEGDFGVTVVTLK